MATPTPIPALAPLDNPGEAGTCVELVVGDWFVAVAEVVEPVAPVARVRSEALKLICTIGAFLSISK